MTEPSIPLHRMKKSDLLAYAHDLERQLTEARQAQYDAEYELEHGEKADALREEGFREGIEIAAEDVSTALDLMELDGELDWELRYKIAGKIKDFLETVTESAHEVVQ